MSQGKIISDVLVRPLSDVLVSIGKGIADTQIALDRNSADTQIFIENDEILSTYGLSATWYHMPEIELELKLALSIHEETIVDADVSKAKIFGVPLDASYTRNYDYDVKGSSLLRIKIASIPPPSSLEAEP